MNSPAPTLADYPIRTSDKIRYADTDRQGHVNNAVFSTFIETARAEIIYDRVAPLVESGTSFVIARLAVDFRAEINWPGTLWIGTRVAQIGRSSFTLQHGLFQDERCVATAEVVIVQVNDATRKSRALSAAALERLSKLQKT
jgi:acyl-CoA thioester hydrolase